MEVAKNYRAARNPGTYCMMFMQYDRGISTRDEQAKHLKRLRALGARLIKWFWNDKVCKGYEYPCERFDEA